MTTARAYAAGVLPVIWLLAGGQLIAQQDRMIRGTVLDSASAEPVAAAEVIAAPPGKTVDTDPHGHFRLTSLPRGPVTVTVRAIGYAPRQYSVDLTTGDVALPVTLSARTFELEEIVVSAPTGAEEALREAQATARLSSADVAAERGQTLGETLKELPGVAVLQYGPSIAKPVVRGLHSHRIIVMNEGVRQEGQQWGGEHAPEVDAFAAHEIEVIRGAGAILYGSDALGGVVRVLARPLPTSPGVGGEVAVNSFANNRQVAGSVLLEAGDLDLPALGASALRLRATRRRAGDATTPDYNLQNTGFSEFDVAAALGITRPWGRSSIDVSRFDTELGLFTGAHVGNFEDLQRAMNAPPRSTDFRYEIAPPKQTVRHDRVSWNTEALLSGGLRGEASLAYQFNRREEFDNHGPLADRDIPAFALDLHTYSVDLRLHHAAAGPLSGTLGLNGLRQGNLSRGKGFLIPQYRLYTGGVYALEELALDHLTLSAGVRYDYRWQHVFPFSDAGIESVDEVRGYSGLAGLLSASYLLTPAWSIATSIGRSWRAPNVNERFSQGVHHGTAQYEIGDIALTTEAAVNLDLTLRHQSRRVAFELSAYRNVVDGYIYLHPRDPVLTIRGAFPGYNYRQTDATLRGIDLALNAQLTSWLSLEASGNVVRGHNEALDEPLYDMPADRLSIAARWEARGGDRAIGPYVEVGGLLVREQDQVPSVTIYSLPTDGYALLNLEVGVRRLWFGSTAVEANLAVGNVLNTSYRDYLSRYKLFVDDPGRDVVLRLRVPFGIARRETTQPSWTN